MSAGAAVHVALRRALLRWYDRERRELPWRGTADPYAIWVSEVMLQQTTVNAVIPYYERFLAAFPDASALARASEDRVLALWAGLGYYRRARALREAARELVRRHGGALPRTADGLRRLPGFGPYTAGAVASIAFGEVEPAIDGNAARVLSRIAALAAPRPRELRELALRLIDRRRPGDFNQALMELGARVCTPRAPRCEECPLAARCTARAGGQAEALPRPAARREPVRLARGAVRIVDRRGRVLFARAPEGAPNAGLWELPWAELADAPAAPDAIVTAVGARHGLPLRGGSLLGTVRHAITYRRIVVHVVAARLAGGAPRGDGWRWLAPADATSAGITAATRKALALSLDE